MAEQEQTYRYLFGPVPSRRLGRSLGVDVVPFKVCSFDCVYCQLGRTTELTTARKSFTSAEDVIAEFSRWLVDDGQADYITLSGSGEPTLNSEIGEVISWIRSHTHIPVALLTNGSLLYDKDVRRDIKSVDLVIPSLDAGTNETLEKVNRSAAHLEIEQIVDGIARTRLECEGAMWLEVMLLAGINDSDEELLALRKAIERIHPHRVQINTVVRPPAEAYAEALGPYQLRHAQEMLGPLAEIVAPLPEDYEGDASHQKTAEEVYSLLQRRPCTLKDIAIGLGIHMNEATKYVQALLDQQRIVTERKGAGVYYRLR